MLITMDGDTLETLFYELKNGKFKWSNVLSEPCGPCDRNDKQ